MDRNYIEQIFEHSKERYLRDLSSVEYPTAYILGGQPSSGKSSISTKHINEENILIVNGDEYRIHHPRVKDLSTNVSEYSKETQEFSNVFTEGFIREAIARKFNIVVEGTMRRPEVVLATAKMFRDAGFRVEAHAIAAPEEFSKINIFHRYHKAIYQGEMGRLSDLEVHQQALEGLIKTLDRLYSEKAVDRIQIYSMFGDRIEGKYTLSLSGKWIGSTTPPSYIVALSRENQLRSLESNHLFLARGAESFISISSQPNLVEYLSQSISILSRNLKTITPRKDQIETILQVQKLEDDIQRIIYSSQTLKDKYLPELWGKIVQYNKNRAIELGRPITEISINQAISMVLDGRIYKQNDEQISANKGELLVNGTAYTQERGNGENLSHKLSR